MNIKDILSHTDHTLLTQTATWDEIKSICDEGMEFGCASVCIPPCFVKQAKQYTGNKIKVCTVIGFPNGYNTTEVKCFETKMAVEDGADEIDMVINIGMVKEKNFEGVLNEIKAVRETCKDKVLKVIIETCLLNDDEKVKMCHTVTLSGADYIKTSTGFGGDGATFSDIELFAKNVGENIKIKAAGGISSLADAEKFIMLGADRLGSSRIVELAKEAKNID